MSGTEIVPQAQKHLLPATEISAAEKGLSMTVCVNLPAVCNYPCTARGETARAARERHSPLNPLVGRNVRADRTLEGRGSG